MFLERSVLVVNLNVIVTVLAKLKQELENIPLKKYSINSSIIILFG